MSNKFAVKPASMGAVISPVNNTVKVASKFTVKFVVKV
jgi:hypothetical protein